jgi:hypothetical protein
MLHGGDSLEFQFQQSCNITIHDPGSEKIEEKKTWSGLLPSMVVSVTCVVPHPLAHIVQDQVQICQEQNFGGFSWLFPR